MSTLWPLTWTLLLCGAAISDLRSRRIPDWLVGLGMVLALLAAAGQGGGRAVAAAVIGGLVALALFGPVHLLARRQTRPGFGLADVKLAVLVGLICSWPLAVPALLLGMAAGGLAALGVVVWQLGRGQLAPGTALPYAPFLAAGGLAAVWAGPWLAAAWNTLGIP